MVLAQISGSTSVLISFSESDLFYIAHTNAPGDVDHDVPIGGYGHPSLDHSTIIYCDWSETPNTFNASVYFGYFRHSIHWTRVFHS